jgi:glutamyl-tRNA reductase
MNTLRYIALSHKYVSTENRSSFSMNTDDSDRFSKNLVAKYPDIKGLLILNTCNRIEIYIESEMTTSQKVFNEMVLFSKANLQSGVLFSDDTITSSERLFEVASGLDSSLLGDKQIFFQLKNAYLNSASIKLQGSILERTFQYINQLHKKIINTTQFYTNSNSYGYLSLKATKEFALKNNSRGNVLLLGAGQMIREVASYLNKFNFDNVVISNRTAYNALAIAEKYNLEIRDYSTTFNTLEEFDVIISAVSHQSNIINPSNLPLSKKQLLIDLGSPSNINTSIAENNFKTLLDLQYFNNVFNKNKTLAITDREKVVSLKTNFHNQFTSWHSQYSNRAALSILDENTYS